jgi:RecJ-like exonuclease
MEGQRFLCPVCQLAWTGAKDAPCEECHAVALAWNAGMVEACKCKPVLIGKEAILCAGKGCLEEVKEEDDLCPECAQANEEYLHDRAQELRDDIARDDHYMRKIDEARGK